MNPHCPSCHPYPCDCLRPDPITPASEGDTSRKPSACAPERAQELVGIPAGESGGLLRGRALEIVNTIFDLIATEPPDAIDRIYALQDDLSRLLNGSRLQIELRPVAEKAKQAAQREAAKGGA